MKELASSPFGHPEAQERAKKPSGRDKAPTFKVAFRERLYQ